MGWHSLRLLVARAVRQQKRDKMKTDETKTGLNKMKTYFRQHMGIIAAITKGKETADISYCDGQAEKLVAFEHIRVRVELSANEKRVITVAKKKAEKEGATAAAAGEQLTKAYEEFMEDEIAPASQEY